MSLLHVENLHMHFVSRSLGNEVRVATALNGVSFDVGAGEIVGLVGETGAGKSLTAMSIMRLLRAPGRIVAGSIRFGEVDLVALDQRTLRSLRGREMAMIVQNPKMSLDPISTVGDQLVRAQRAHGRVGRAEAEARALQALRDVGIPDAQQRMSAWPHELSGGMAQRILIALALINRPRLLIADEPTTGLDATVQAQILNLLRERVQRDGLGVIVITHDLGVVAQYCERMLVMFAGNIVEGGTVDAVFGNPAHPYTINLLNATPERMRLGRTRPINSMPPNLFALPRGCAYRDRCPKATDICGTTPPAKIVGNGHVAHCHHVEAFAKADA